MSWYIGHSLTGSGTGLYRLGLGSQSEKKCSSWRWASDQSSCTSCNHMADSGSTLSLILLLIGKSAVKLSLQRVGVSHCIEITCGSRESAHGWVVNSYACVVNNANGGYHELVQRKRFFFVALQYGHRLTLKETSSAGAYQPTPVSSKRLYPRPETLKWRHKIRLKVHQPNAMLSWANCTNFTES